MPLNAWSHPTAFEGCFFSKDPNEVQEIEWWYFNIDEDELF
jgi:hypothetical protein